MPAMEERDVTLREALAAATARLEKAGVESPLLDAQLLLAHVLGRDRTYVRAHLPDSLPTGIAAEFDSLVARREAREPLPYLLGRWEFLGMPFEVGPGVLIPRPETELLVEAAAARLGAGARILEVGPGSGCICAGLAHLLPAAEIVGLEISPAAAAIAARNVQALGFEERVRIIEGAYPEAARELGRFDAVVSNPPYIPSAEVDRLAPELLQFEPRQALDGGVEGLDVLLPLVAQAPGLLTEEGLLALEVGAGQAEGVAERIRRSGKWRQPEILPDLAGIPRVVLARVQL